MNDEQAGHILQAHAPADQFLQFIRAMVEADAFVTDVRGDFGEFVSFLEKPWKWSREFAAFNDAGCPLDASERGWEQFLAALDQ